VIKLGVWTGFGQSEGVQDIIQNSYMQKAQFLAPTKQGQTLLQTQFLSPNELF
jgi:hypothetical protein